MNTLFDMSDNKDSWPELRDLILSEQMCPTRVALLYRRAPEFAKYMACYVPATMVTA